MFSERGVVSNAAASFGNVIQLDAFRVGKAYTIAHAARLAGATASTVRRWHLGYEVPGHQMVPVFGQRRQRRDDEPLMLSFLDLVELIVAVRLRRGSGGRAIKLERIRLAHKYARQALELPYPFASLRLREMGGHIFHEFDEQNPHGARLALDLAGQWGLPLAVTTEFDEHLEFSLDPATDPFALRWYPYGHAVPVVVDPHVAAGQLSVAGTGVTIATLNGRRVAGESMRDLARDYAIPVKVVREVLTHAA
jgi:uncharacterized protein (DUF433 family)